MTLGFLNIGTQEMILIVIVILLLFGGKKLPELARGLGRGIREFKDASEGIKREISDQINNFEKDLDVTVEDEPQKKLAQESETTVAKKDEADDSQSSENKLAQEQVKPAAEKKPLPTFTAPENTYQHNPGQQPSSGDDHYTYGYNDHFAKEADAKEDTVTVEKSAGTGESTKNA